MSTVILFLCYQIKRLSIYKEDRNYLASTGLKVSQSAITVPMLMTWSAQLVSVSITANLLIPHPPYFSHEYYIENGRERQGSKNVSLLTKESESIN